MSTLEVRLPVLKRDDFARPMAAAFSGPLPHEPLDDRRYRRILVPGLAGGEMHFSILGLIGQALRIRGAEVTFLSCDALLPACVHRKIDHHESACTRWCHRNAGPFAEAMALPHQWYGQWITAPERESCDRMADDVPIDELADVVRDEIELGPLVIQSVQSYLKVGSVDLDDPDVVAVARRFLRSALYLSIIGHRALETLRIDKVFTDNGVQVDWGVIRAVAGRHGIPVDVVQTSPRPQMLQFEHDRGPERFVRMPQWPRWREMPLTAAQNAALDDYLAERELTPYLSKFEDWSSRITDTKTAFGHLRCDDPSSTVFVMFTNVGYDAGATKGQPAFDTGPAWSLRTIEFFRGRPDHRLIIKAHPAERHLAARDPLETILAGTDLPPNVTVIDADSPITAQCALRMADVALLYTSTVCVEAAGLNVPTIMVGDGIHAHRGFALEPATDTEYLRLLDDVCAGRRSVSPPGDVGRRYAYAAFFRAALPMRFYDRLDHEITAVHLRSADELRPGRDAALDAICRGILCDASIEHDPA